MILGHQIFVAKSVLNLSQGEACQRGRGEEHSDDEKAGEEAVAESLVGEECAERGNGGFCWRPNVWMIPQTSGPPNPSAGGFPDALGDPLAYLGRALLLPRRSCWREERQLS